MERNPRNVRFADLQYVCDRAFGRARVRGSHRFYSMPWEGEPLVNIQDAGGRAKSYQVRQVLAALRKQAEENDG